MNYQYKCSGSVVMWVLHNKLHRAFTVWMLAQKLDRKSNEKPTGYIRDGFFADWVRRSISCQTKTTEKYIEEAVQCGFLEQIGNRYLIRGHRRMFTIAMNDQQKRHECNNTNIVPELFIKSDREFTLDFKEWVDPQDMDRTTALLSGIAAIQNSVVCRGKENQSKLLNCDRRTLQRRGDDNNTREFDRFIMIDVCRLLEEPACSPDTIARIFMEAESTYRRSRHYVCGRKLLHRRKLNGKTYLAIQIPGVCIHTSEDMKEVPLIRESVKWLHHRAGGQELCPVALPHVSEGDATADPAINDTSDLCLSVQAGWPLRFIGSGNISGVELPNSKLSNYLHFFDELLSSEEYSSMVLSETGALRIRQITETNPFVYVPNFPQRRPQRETISIETSDTGSKSLGSGIPPN